MINFKCEFCGSHLIALAVIPSVKEAYYVCDNCGEELKQVNWKDVIEK